MATLKSRYSDAISADVPNDTLPPKPAVLGNITLSQDEAVTNGRSIVTCNWTIPTQNVDIDGEYLGAATGAAQDLESLYDPVVAATYTVYEDTGDTAGGLSTTLSSAAAVNDITIDVVSVVNAAAGDWVKIVEGGKTEYAQIDSIATLTFTLKAMLRNSFTTSATVVEVDVTTKTETTDYTIVLATGVLSLVAGQFTATNGVFFSYTTILNDLDGFELYRIPGNMPLANGSDYAAVTGHGSVVTVDNAITAVSTSKAETLGSTENGETWTYYLFAKDDESTPNYSVSVAVFVETCPSLPEGLGKTVGDVQVILTWDALPGTSDANTNGFNVFRDDGATFEDSTCKQLNSAIIAKGVQTFDDSANNTSNRVSAGTVPYPVNGTYYSYKVETQDTDTSWTTGTQNQSDGVSANYTASKAA